MFDDNLYSLIPYNINGGGIMDPTMFKRAVQERFRNMVQNCHVYYSNGDMYVQVDETVYRKISHQILGRFENIDYITLYYLVTEDYPDGEIVALLEDTIICEEIKEVVIAMYQLTQYEKMFWVLYVNIQPDIPIILQPVNVKVHYCNGEIRYYPHMDIFNKEFFRFEKEEDVNGFIQP